MWHECIGSCVSKSVLGGCIIDSMRNKISKRFLPASETEMRFGTGAEEAVSFHLVWPTRCFLFNRIERVDGS